MITSIQVHNVALGLLMTIIDTAGIILFDYFLRKRFLSNELTRKALHISVGIVYLSIYFFDDRGQYSKYLHAFQYAVYAVIFIWKGQFSSPDQKPDFLNRAFTRNNRPSELLGGPLLYTVVFIICSTLLYKTVVASIIVAILTWGDGLAAIIGLQFGNKMKIYRSKSLPGFLTVWVAGVLASIVYISILVGYEYVNLMQLCFIGLVAAIVEMFSPGDYDNLTIALAAFVTHRLIS
jgi:phytol kinase